MNTDTVYVPKDDIGTMCDVAETIHQHANAGTKQLVIELPESLCGDNRYSWDYYDTLKDELQWYGDDMYELEDVNFTIEEVNNTFVITF